MNENEQWSDGAEIQDVPEGEAGLAEEDGSDPCAPETHLVKELAEALKASKAKSSELTQERDQLKDSYLRARADLENFRKRTAREKVEWGERSEMDVLRKMLPVMDNFERAVLSSKDSRDFDALATGLDMILRQMKDSLTEAGAQRIESLGQPFDPHQHEAMAVVDSSEVTEETVVTEIEAGYTYKGKLLRPARVQVAKPTNNVDTPSPDEASSDEATELTSGE